MLSEAVCRHDGLAAEAVRAKGADECADCRRVDRLRAVDRVPQAVQLECRPRLWVERVPLARGERVGKRRGLRVRRALVGEEARPERRILDEREGRAVCALAAADEQPEVRADQAHVVVLRQPRHLDRRAVDLQRGDDPADVVREVGVGDAHALWLCRRAARVLQEGDGGRRRPFERASGRVAERVGHNPRQLGPLATVAAEELREAGKLLRVRVERVRQRHARAAARLSRGEVNKVLAQSRRLWRERRHGDHAGAEAAEVGDDEVESGRVHEQRARPHLHLGDEAQVARDVVGRGVELRV
mmetsp:Transcript_16699/g.51909  ORF Transcript_16699/g.51909 Transcript_16699/m.51909 type:complete len:301 (-) Transcript_16699:200-1102(-)